MEYVDLTYTQVALAALLILINGAISLALRLGMERTLAWAACGLCCSCGWSAWCWSGCSRLTAGILSWPCSR